MSEKCKKGEEKGRWWSNLGQLICLRYLIRSRAVTIFFPRKDPFSFLRAQHVVSYHVIYTLRLLSISIISRIFFKKCTIPLINVLRKGRLDFQACITCASIGPCQKKYTTILLKLVNVTCISLTLFMIRGKSWLLE